ncbi:hypothetical protein BRAS3843_3350054 [Bradyrhizobium sp. STM 3843]|nr:hypothetical protein BRAS3843_3350054 [Bradyrhizobium sp. STM 3843]
MSGAVEKDLHLVPARGKTFGFSAMHSLPLLLLLQRSADSRWSAEEAMRERAWRWIYSSSTPLQ